jgi:CheY-like chemotaxis protein
MQDVELIDIYKIAEIFKKSIETIRKYKQMGLIKAYCTEGRKDFFDRAEIIIRKNYIESLINDGRQLNEIPPFIERFEKSLPKYLTIKEGQKKLLLIDDDKAVCDLLSSIIAKGFHENSLTIFTAYDGESALEIAKKIIPDLIISDIALETNGMTGIMLYEKIKSDPELQKLKIVFISSVVEFHPEETFFLRKPINMNDLIEVVAALCGIEPNRSVLQTLR